MQNELLALVLGIGLVLGGAGIKLLPWFVQKLTDAPKVEKTENGNVMKAEISWLKASFEEFRKDYKHDQENLWKKLDELVTEAECNRRHPIK